MSEKEPASEKQPVSKTGFILSQPEGMPAKEVTAKAKEVGIKLTEQYVHTVRSSARKSKKSSAKKSLSKRLGKNPTAISKLAASAQGTTAKGSFVLTRLAAGVPVKDIIAESKKQGMKVSKSYVYMLRDRAQMAPSVAPSRAVATKKSIAPKIVHSAPKSTATTVSATEIQFQKLAIEIGLHRSEELLASAKKKLDQLLRSI